MKRNSFTKILPFGIFWLKLLVKDLVCSGEIVCCKELTDLEGCKETAMIFADLIKIKSAKNCLNVTEFRPCQTNSSTRVKKLKRQVKPNEMAIKVQRKEPIKRKIRIGAFVPFLKDDSFGVKKAFKMAFNLINNRSDILANCTLILDAQDTDSGSAAKTTAALFKFLNKNNRPVILLGPPTREGLETIAQAVRLWKLVQVSYATDSHLTKGKSLDPTNTYVAAHSSALYKGAVVAFIKYYGWKRVAILYQISSRFLQTVAILKRKLTRENISIIVSEGFDKFDDASFQMEKLKSLDAKIIVGVFNLEGAGIVFCQAFMKKMYGANYAWIVDGNFHPKVLFRYNLSLRGNVTCSSDDLKQATDGYISMIQLNTRPNNTRAISGMTSKTFWSQIGSISKKKQFKKAAEYAFDSAWIIALALHGCFTEGMKFQNLRVRSADEVSLVMKWINKTNFYGITGHVRFNKNNERAGKILIKQNRKGDMIRIGWIFTSNLKRVKISEPEREKIWKDNKPPQDHTDTEHNLLMIPVPLMITMCFLAGTGVVLSLGFLYFNIKNQESRIIRMSSPNLNNIIVLGCILSYVSVILFGLDARFLNVEGYTKICNVRTVVLSVGYSLSFGSMFSKTWRVYKIFTAGMSCKKMAIKDRHLLIIVIGLLTVDVIFLSFWISLDPFYTKILTIQDKIRREPDVIKIPALYRCTCQYDTYFLGVLFAYKGLVLLFGVFLAWQTRNVTIPALNDSKYIGMSVYNVVVLSIIGAVISLTFGGPPNYEVPYAILSLCLILCTTLTLLLVFVPKIYHFRKKNEAATHVIRGYGDLDLMEGQTGSQFKTRATQTDCDVTKSEARDVSLSDEIPNQVKSQSGDENMVVVLRPRACGVAVKKNIKIRSSSMK